MSKYGCARAAAANLAWQISNATGKWIIESKRGRTTRTKDMSPQRTVKRMWRPSLLKLPPVSNRMKVETKSAPMVYRRAQCTGGSSLHAVACLALCTQQPHTSHTCQNLMYTTLAKLALSSTVSMLRKGLYVPEHGPTSERPAGSLPRQYQPCGSCVPLPGLLQGHGPRPGAETGSLAGTSPGQCTPCTSSSDVNLCCFSCHKHPTAPSYWRPRRCPSTTFSIARIEYTCHCQLT